jgi:urease accessory protein
MERDGRRHGDARLRPASPPPFGDERCQAIALRDGDGLALDDGRIVAVHAAPEPLAEITAHSAPELLRVAWHLGNRHLPAQLERDRIRIRRDHVIEEMVEGLDAHVAHIQAPFDPEGGAYAGGGHHHHHHDADDHHVDGALEHDDRLDDEDTGRG